jgi:Winged helix-turn helix
MPRPIPVPVRQAIWRRSQDGQDGPAIAKALGLTPRTVRRLVRRFRQEGQAALIPSYDRCGAATPKPSVSICSPPWGSAESIRHGERA